MLRHPSRSRNAQYGITLVEVLVSIVIVAFGLLGLAGLLVKGVALDVSAYDRTIVTQKIYGLADRMRLNPAGVQGNNYVTAAAAGGACAPCPPAGGGTCTPAQVAQLDLCQWANELSNSLAAPLTGPIASVMNPTSGVLTITVNWQGRDRLLKNPVTQTYSVNVRP